MNITGIKRVGHRGLLQLKKYSPQILTTVGIVGGVVTTVMASKATLKLEPIITDMEADLEEIKQNAAVAKMDVPPQELGYVYGRYGLQIAKLYGPAFSLGTASIVAIVSGQGLMHRRNAAITAAYVAIEKGFAEYRDRVASALGEDKERELRYDVIKTEKVKNDDGTTTEVAHFGPNGHSVYARFFDEYSEYWDKTPEYNMLHIKCQQNYWNDMLHARGHVFLNEVYDSLGIPRSQAGQVVGWVVSDDGDNYIDFGVFRKDSEEVRAFVNGYERSILLDFNVDGQIYDKI